MTPHERIQAARLLEEKILALHHRRMKDQARLAYTLAKLDETKGYRDLGYPSVRAFAKVASPYNRFMICSMNPASTMEIFRTILESV